MKGIFISTLFHFNSFFKSDIVILSHSTGRNNVHIGNKLVSAVWNKGKKQKPYESGVELKSTRRNTFNGRMATQQHNTHYKITHIGELRLTSTHRHQI